MSTLFLDLEVFCEVPIQNGTHAYAEKAEVLLFAYALDNGPVYVWDVASGEKMPDDLHWALIDKNVLLCAHNSHFDRTVLRHAMPGYPLALPRWRDTMVKALAHSLPGSLGDLCDILKVPTDKAKAKDGRQLIMLFCKPRPATSKLRRATRETHSAQWAKFVEYAGLDIAAMRAVDKKLPTWNYRGIELALWHLDQTINDRGVMVDTDLAHAAIRAVEREQKVLAARTSDITQGAVATSPRARCKRPPSATPCYATCSQPMASTCGTCSNRRWSGAWLTPICRSNCANCWVSAFRPAPPVPASTRP